MKTLDETVDTLRTMGEQLIPYNYPRNHPGLEDFVGLFKTTLVEVDGYTIRVHFNKMDYETHFVETCQMSGENIPFIPFNVVIKVGQKFLGGHYLSLIEQVIEGKTYWCWAVCVDQRGCPLPWMHPMKMRQCEYDGFEFQYVKSGEVNFH
jgi:hypothetical protein